ncbi:MAG: aldose 1-epimerase family protein [Clostridiales bacterium]|nr:aldose 1-epimerase family protein [Clostridiales bacterium]
METTISSEQLTVICDTKGGEQRAITSREGIDYLWNGDARYWGGRAPTLFPFVGRLRGNRADSAAGEIRLPRHGLARQYEWTVEKADAASVTYFLASDERTREGYPYDFEMRICHTVEGASVTTAYTVHNRGDIPMPFCIGAHPGYRVPLDERDAFEDYTVEFEYPETADCPQVDGATGLLVDSVRNRFLSDERSFRLNHVLFRGDALIFDTLKSRSVRVFSRRSGRGFHMDFEGFDYFGIWSSSADAPLLCLEPWTGTATGDSEDDVFEHKRGMRLLAPGEEARYHFTLTVF